VSRRRRLVVLLVVALVGLAVAGALAAPEIVRRVVVWRMAVLTGRPVALAALELDLFDGRLALRDLRVTDRDQGPLATIERLEARFSVRELLGGHLRVTNAMLQAPTIRIVRTGPRDFNVSDVLAGGSSGGAALAITLERVEVRGGVITIEDRTLAPPRTWRVEALTLDARGVSTVAGAPAGVVTLSAVAAGSPISVWGSGVRLAPPRFHATIIAREIDGALAALYLPPGSPLSPARATLDVSATIEHDAAAGTRVSLDAVFGGLELRRPEEDSTFLFAPAVRVTVEDLRLGPDAVELGRLAVDGGRAVLQDARLGAGRRWQADGIMLEARHLSSARQAPAGVGVIRAVVAGSPVSVWIANLRLAPLALHATAVIRDVDFALLRLYVPPDLPVQPARGTVNASLRIDHDAARGTRLALDAVLSGVELRRPAHVVRAPSVRVTVEDIAFAAGAVTVGGIAIGGERLLLEELAPGPARRWDVRDLTVEAHRLSSRRQDVQGIVTARAIVAGAAVAAWITHVRLDPLELRATAILRALDLALVQLYLPATAPVQLDRGIVNASLQVDHDVTGGTRLTGDVTLTGVQARGRGPADRLAVSAASLRLALAGARRHASGLDVGRLELTGVGARLDTDAGAVRVDLERVRIASEDVTWPIRGPARVEMSARFRDGAEVDARGIALLTAPPPLLAWTTELAVQLTGVDIGPAAAAIPIATGLTGRVSANVSATVAYGASLAARVQGDVGGIQLALAEGGQTVLSIPRLDATGLDLLWGERISIGRLRMQRPHALVEIGPRGVLPLAARLARPAPPGSPPAPATTGPTGPAVAVDEMIVERGALAFTDRRGATAVRFDLPRVDATFRELRWPASAPARVRLDAALPAGGALAIDGTVIGEPGGVDVRVALADADLALLQPYLPFRATVRSRVDATLAITGPLAPAPRLSVRGDVTLRRLAVSDGQRAVLTVERVGATGVDARWPDRLSLAQVRVRRSWALLERDRQGRLLLPELLARPPAAASPSPSPTPGAAGFALRLAEGIFEEGAATIVDGVTTPPARLEIAGARLVVHDLAWPSGGQARVQLSSPTPDGGRLDVGGTVNLDPLRVEVRAALNAVELAPAQPYLPIESRVAGRVSGDLAVTVALDPVAVKVGGQARLQRFRLSDGDRPVLTVGLAEALGIDIDWPARIAVERVRFRRPRLLIERDAEGGFAVRRLAMPRRAGPDPAAPTAASPVRSTDGAAAPPTIEIGTFSLERASGRFVDHTTTPPYVEELSGVDLTVTGATTAPDRHARFTGRGTLGGGATLTFLGEAAAGERSLLELRADVRDLALPRANPYLDRLTGWTATRGTLTASARYTLLGTRLDTRHDLTIRGLDVAPAGAGDEVARRLGLPLGFLVSLLKDARGEIRLSIPVSGDLSTREFDFREAAWGAVHTLAIRLLALPFSRVGSLVFSEDSKVEAVALDPVVFEPGTTRLGPAMVDHLDRVAAFLRAAPAVTLRLAPILTQADLDALTRERARAGSGPGLPPAALRDLGAARLEVVRRDLSARGGIDAGRLGGSSRRVPLVEAAGVARVELDLRPDPR
jgi:hypothetical protein